MRKFAAVAISLLFIAACSPKSDLGFGTPDPNKDKNKIDADFQVFTPTADILFVIDDSGSMGVHQSNLIANIGTFTNEFTQGAALDYHIGVVTTDTYDSYKDGKLQGRIPFITPQTPNGMSELAANMRVGTMGSGTEAPFDAAAALFSAENATINAGFVRPEAALAVVFITDAEDQSSNMRTAQDLYDFLVKQKGGDTNKILGYGAVVVDGEIPGCYPDDSGVLPNRIFNFLDLVMNKGSNTLRLCQPDFGKQLAKWAQNIVANAGRTIYLKELPDLKSVVVKYGSMILPKDADKGWSYDPAKNAIRIGDSIDWASQPLGSQIKVHYRAISPDGHVQN